MKVLYITTSFTALSSTFITREINELRSMGHYISLLATRESKAPKATSPEADLSDCQYIYPSPFPTNFFGFLGVLIRHPGRMFRAIGLALGSRGDTPLQRMKLLYQLFVVSRFVPWLEDKGIEHIHAHFATTPTTFALFLATLTKTTFTFTDHGSGLFHDQIGVENKFQLASGISAISEYNVRFYSQVASTVPPVKIVRCGLAMDDFEFHQHERVGDPIRILAISRIVPKKGFSFLLDALKILEDRGINWEAKFVGAGSSLEDLKKQSAALGLSSIEFTGPMQQGDIRQLLYTWDMLVLPCVVAPDGDMDGIPVTLMEAMACGCPVISTNLSGIPELVIDGKTGLLLEPENTQAIVDAILRLRDDPGLVARISTGGRSHVETEFNISESARRLSRFFGEVQGAAK